MSGGAARQVMDDEPAMIAWKRYVETEDYKNSSKWLSEPSARRGAMWAAFIAGFVAATERGGNLHEDVNPASDEERLSGTPGAGAMGAVIEYRDTIRKGLL